jgi:hypothetical protein
LFGSSPQLCELALGLGCSRRRGSEFGSRPLQSGTRVLGRTAVPRHLGTQPLGHAAVLCHLGTQLISFTRGASDFTA